MQVKGQIRAMRMRDGSYRTMSQLDRDVAHYVLAYLARQGYSHTMSVFLQECSSLPPNTTMMVLPETPLSTIIAEHKSRKESDLLVGKLGPQASWDALWEKLQHYLNQLRILSNSLLESHHDHPSSKKSTERKKQYCMKTTQKHPLSSCVASSLPPSPSHMCNVDNTPASHVPAAHVASSPALPPPPASSSPRKKREPTRLQPYSDTLVAPPVSSVGMPAPQQLLDILLEDESLQHHLAHLINSSLLSDGAAELTDDALDNILAMSTSPDTTHMLPVTMAIGAAAAAENQPDGSGPQSKKRRSEEETNCQ